MSNDEFQKIVLEKFDNIDKKFENIDKRFDNIDKKFDNIDKKFDNIDKRFDNIETEQVEIKQMLTEMEIKNATRHIEFQKELNKLKFSINTLEKVTAKNWADITELRDAK